MSVTSMEISTDRELQLEKPLKRRCLRGPIVRHTSSQNGAPERAIQKTDKADFFECEENVNFFKSYHDDYGSMPLEAYGYGSSSGGDELVDPQYKIFFESLRVTSKSYALEVEVDVGTSILLKYDIEDQPHEGIPSEFWKSRTLKDTEETARSLRNAVGREKDQAAASMREENVKERRIPRNVSGREKESLQTTKAAAISTGNCDLDERNIEAQPANFVSNGAIRRSPRLLRLEVQQASEHLEETPDESYLALMNDAKDDVNILEFISDNGKQTTKAAATSTGNCNLDERNIEAQPANFVCSGAIRRSPRLLYPEVQQASEHLEETPDESYPALMNDAKDDVNILEFISDIGKQTTKAAAMSKGNCNLDKRKIEAHAVNLGSKRATRQSRRLLCAKVRQDEEATWDESYLSLLNGTKNDGNILEFTSENAKQTTKAAARNKRKCNLDIRNPEAQPANPVSTQAIRQSPRILHPEVRQTPKHEEEPWDESYLTFLHCAREDGSVVEYVFDEGKQIKYGEYDEESSCEVEVLAGEDIFKCEEFVTMKLAKNPITIDSKHFADDPGRSSGTVFRKKLMGVLKKPYDPKEYEDLYRGVSKQRQKTLEKSLRKGRDFTSSLGQCCKSYLELYNDLAKKLESVRDNSHRKLNLLRGFFFWLENIPKEGAFMPWLDPTCLKVLPAPEN